MELGRLLAQRVPRLLIKHQGGVQYEALTLGGVVAHLGNARSRVAGGHGRPRRRPREVTGREVMGGQNELGRALAHRGVHAVVKGAPFHHGVGVPGYHKVSSLEQAEARLLEPRLRGA